MASGRDSNAVTSARWTGAMILLFMLGQVAFLLVRCPWDFSGDEAEFWAWSRRLDWSYFARGPLIAWLIRIPVELIEPWGVRSADSLMFAARLPAILLGGLTAWGVYRLGSLTTSSCRAGMFAAFLMPVIPVFAIGGVLITCDTPLVCCWVWSAVWSYRAMRNNSLRAWTAAGIIAACGVLAKYSELAFPASLALYITLDPQRRREWLQPGFWVMSGLCVVLGLGPIVFWNLRHQWASAGQLADRVGLSQRAVWGHVLPVLGFLGGEILSLGVVWWIVGVLALGGACVTVLRASKVRNGADRPGASELPGGSSGLLFILCLWAVIWAACLAASVLGETEMNWMVPGYVSLLILMGWRIDRQSRLKRGKFSVYGTAWCFSLAAVVAIHHSDWFYPALAPWIPEPDERWAAPLRYFDMTARLRGHQQLAREVQERVAALRAQGESPFVLTPTYALAATLSFYLPGQPETYCLSWNYGMTADPVNQHDLWHPNPRHDPQAFRGRPAVVVEDANMPPGYAKVLAHKGVVARAARVERILAREHGVVVGAWDITICPGYHGLDGFVQSPRLSPAASGESAPQLARRLDTVGRTRTY